MTRKRGATALAWLVGLLLLAWVLRQVSWRALWEILRGLTWGQVGLLALLNGLILLGLTARWRAFVSVLPRPLSFMMLFQARLAAFALSYFTPGPQFGGEPIQVVVQHLAGTPLSAATATVGLDKLVELVTNFAVLGLGVVALWVVGLGSAQARWWASLWVLALLLMPLGYSVLLWRGWYPLARLLGWMRTWHKAAWWQRGLGMLVQSESLAVDLVRVRPRALVWALGWSMLAWVGMMVEFGLSARFLGAALSPLETLAALAAVRFAFLLPMPGGLGALSASLMIVFTALGYDPNAALALSFYIRARDLMLGLLGMLLAGRLVPGKHL